MGEDFSTSNTMTSSGRVAPLGIFGGAEVLSVRPGGTQPSIALWHGQGRDAVTLGHVAASVGAKVEGHWNCPNGIWLEVAGDPHDIQVRVWLG